MDRHGLGRSRLIQTVADYRRYPVLLTGSASSETKTALHSSTARGMGLSRCLSTRAKPSQVCHAPRTVPVWRLTTIRTMDPRTAIGLPLTDRAGLIHKSFTKHSPLVRCLVHRRVIAWQ